MGGCCACARPSEKALADDGRSSATPKYERVIWPDAPRQEKEMKYQLKEHFWTLGGDDYTVKDSEGKDLFKVESQILTFRDCMLMKSPKGDENICMIQEKLEDESFNESMTFQIFTYKPNTEGQESTEKQNGVPVYRYASVVSVLWNRGDNWGDQYNCYLYNGNERNEMPLFSAYRETWRWSWDSKVNVFKGDQIKETDGNLEKCDVVAKFGMFEKSWWANITADNNVYGIEMSPHVDPILLVCFAIICDAIKDKKKRDDG